MLPKIIISLSALFLMGAGLFSVFLPNEIGQYLHLGEGIAPGLMLQLFGGISLGFGVMNWFHRNSLVGGIYNRPLVVANLTHFLIGSLTLIRVLLSGQLPFPMLFLFLVYSGLGVGFAYLMFNTPLSVKKAGSAAALLACFMLCFPGVSGAEGKKPPLEATIQELIAAQQLAGAVFTVVSGDSVSTYAVGKSNLKSGELISKSHKIHVGSITKTMLALGVLRLAKEKRLSLDAPIVSILPDLPISNPWEATHPVTVRHLLDHTAGFSDLRLWHFFSSGAQPNTPLTEFYTRNPEVLQVYAKPGSLFSYSNIGYAILGLIVEKTVQQPYEDYLDEYLLRPIGMQESTFRFTAQTGPYHTERLAMGHFDDGAEATAYSIYLRPAAQFTTTAHDMGRLLKFLLNQGKIGSEAFLDSTHLAAFGNPAYTIASKEGLNNGYAYGLSLRDRHGVVGLAHSGNIVGYKAMLYLFPHQQKGFFISFNMDSETANYEVFYKTLIEYLQLPPVQQAATEHLPAEAFEKWSGYYVPVITKVMPLRLLDVIGSFVKIETIENGMRISPFQNNPVQAVHLGNGVFRAEGKVAASHLLYEQDGALFFTNGFITYQKVSGWGILATALSVASGIVGMFILLIAGAGQLFTRPASLLDNPLVWVFFNLLLLLLAAVLIGIRNIIYIGDQNWGTLSLFIGSALLPFSVLLSGALCVRQTTQVFRKIGFWGLLLLAQLVITLLWYGILPFRSW